MRQLLLVTKLKKFVQFQLCQIRTGSIQHSVYVHEHGLNYS